MFSKLYSPHSKHPSLFWVIRTEIEYINFPPNKLIYIQSRRSSFFASRRNSCVAFACNESAARGHFTAHYRATCSTYTITHVPILMSKAGTVVCENVSFASQPSLEIGGKVHQTCSTQLLLDWNFFHKTRIKMVTKRTF